MGYDIYGSSISVCMFLDVSAISPKVRILHSTDNHFENIGKVDGWVGYHSLQLGYLGLVCVLLASMVFLGESWSGVRIDRWDW